MNTNPYITSNGLPQLRQSVAAFIDILGYSHYIDTVSKDKNKAEEELLRLRTALDTAFTYLKQRSEEIPRDLNRRYYNDMQEESKNERRILNFKVRSFTDSLVLGYPIPGHGDALGVLTSVMDYIGYFQMEMARAGYFIRGAICIGDLYIDEDIIFGPALMEVYRAEQKLAVFPRVILCDNAAEVVKFGWQWSSGKVPGILIDSDNRLFIDYLDQTVMIAYPDAGPFMEFLEGHKTAIEKKIERFTTEPYIRAKYDWAAIYHNAFCDRHPELFGPNDKISRELLSPPPQDFMAAKAETTSEF